MHSRFPFLPYPRERTASPLPPPNIETSYRHFLPFLGYVHTPIALASAGGVCVEVCRLVVHAICTPTGSRHRASGGRSGQKKKRKKVTDLPVTTRLFSPNLTRHPTPNRAVLQSPTTDFLLPPKICERGYHRIRKNKAQISLPYRRNRRKKRPAQRLFFFSFFFFGSHVSPA